MANFRFVANFRFLTLILNNMKTPISKLIKIGGHKVC